MEIKISMKTKILLTGATSFLGKRLQKKLSDKDFDVIATANHRVVEKNIDVMDLVETDNLKKKISKVNPEIIIHAGALVNLSRDFSVGKKCFDVNTIGTMNLLDAVKEYRPKCFIYISSEEVYGNGPIPFKENQRLDPPSPYAVSKVAAEHLSSWYGKEYDFPVTIVRLGTFYGPEQPLEKYFVQTLLNAINNKPIPCNSGKKKRDYIYVDDAVDLIIKIITSNNYSNMIINGAGGKSYRLLDVIKIIKKLTRSKSEVKFGSIPDRITERDEWLSDISQAKELFGWEPKISLEDGLRMMVEHFNT